MALKHDFEFGAEFRDADCVFESGTSKLVRIDCNHENASRLTFFVKVNRLTFSGEKSTMNFEVEFD